MYTTHLGAASSESNYIEIVLAVSFSRTRTSYFFQPKKKYIWMASCTSELTQIKKNNENICH